MEKVEPTPVQRLNYSILEAAVALGIGRTKVYELINQDVLHPLKIGKRTLIPRYQLESLSRGAA